MSVRSRERWRSPRRLALVTALLCAAAWPPGCGRLGQQATPPFDQAPLRYTTPRPADPVHLTIVGDHPSDIGTWTQLADAVVVATVEEVLAARWTTRDGGRPPNPHDPANTATIVTPVRVAVEQHLAGEQQPRRLLLAAQGGTVGQDSMTRGDGLTSFQVGERVVLFLQSRDRELPGLGDRPLWEVLERYTVTPEGVATNAYRTLPLQQLLNQVAALQQLP